MNMHYVVLKTHMLGAQRVFYRDVLGLLLLEDESDQFSVLAGSTKLTFTLTSQELESNYHIAFNIPENQLEASIEWLNTKAPILPRIDNPDEIIHDFKSWNAHSIYFKDAEGNILEFIARHNLDNANESSFNAGSILEISEVGISVEDVAGAAAQLSKNLGLPYFDGKDSEIFSALGDDSGLFIVVPHGREWAPTEDVTSGPLELIVGLQDLEAPFELDELPYRFEPA